jgi:hypothetical protein
MAITKTTEVPKIEVVNMKNFNNNNGDNTWQ